MSAARAATATDEVRVQVHLSWVDDPATTMAVVWKADASAPGSAPLSEPSHALSVRATDTEAWTTVTPEAYDVQGIGRFFRVDLKGLRPSTRYAYKLNAEGRVHEFTTAPADANAAFSFAFFCDTGLIGRTDGNATGTAQVIEEIAKDDPLFLLGGGDYAYADRDGRFERISDAVDEWFHQWHPLLARYPLMAQYGNHETYVRECFEDWAPRFAHPAGHRERDYSFRVGGVHFTSLFVPRAKTLSRERLAWLEADLQSARDSGATWLIVFQHESIFGHGHSHPNKASVRAKLGPILERYRVDLHLSGHDQNYERTYPLRGVPEAIEVRSGSLTEYARGAGVVYAKISPAGKMSEVRQDFSRFTREQQPFIAVRDDTAHHYATVRVEHDILSLSTWSLKGDGSPKECIDRFLIRSHGA